MKKCAEEALENKMILNGFKKRITKNLFIKI